MEPLGGGATWSAVPRPAWAARIWSRGVWGEGPVVVAVGKGGNIWRSAS